MFKSYSYCPCNFSWPQLMPLPMALKVWREGQTFSMKAETQEACLLESWLGWTSYGGSGVAGKAFGWCRCSGRERRCRHPQDSAALGLCLSAGCPVVGSLKSIRGLNHDAVTACVDVLFLCTVAIWWRQREGTGGNDDDGGECFSSLKHPHSYLNGHLCWGTKFFIQNNNKKTP